MGFRYCTHCGAPLPADASACTLCGQPRTPSARDIIEALTQRGYTLQPPDDPYAWCRNCSATMLQRSEDGLSHRICPACGFSDGVLTCTLRFWECTAQPEASRQPQGGDCRLLVQRPSGAEEHFSCQVLPGAEVRLRPGQHIALYFSCGKLSGIQDLKSRMIYHTIDTG